jgi:hypothetical protein
LSKTIEQLVKPEATEATVPYQLSQQGHVKKKKKRRYHL